MNKPFISLLAAMALAYATAAATGRVTVNLNRGWLFSSADSIAGAEAPAFDTSGCVTVNLPHDFQISQPWVAPSPDEMPDSDNPVANVKSRLSSRGFKEMGSGWYRLEFTPEEEWRGRRALLDFEGIMLVGDVWLNGEHIGGTDYGYLGFETDITDRLVYGKKNVIAVKADTGKPENSRWYTGGGLYRDVNLILTDPETYFTRHPLYITTPVAEAEEATVVVRAEISDNRQGAEATNVRLSLYDPEGNRVHSSTKSLPVIARQNPMEYAVDTVTVATPHRWSTSDPALYRAEVEIIDGEGNVIDNASSPFGIRKIEYSPEFGFKLNGEKVLLKGIANHHTLGALGAAAFPAAIEKRLKLLKEFGFNHIRSSHNPYSESFLALCDRYGILVVDELYDKWLTQYAGGRKPWDEMWQHDIPEWVKRDRNHPCVIMWSLGNELQITYDIPHHDFGVTPYRMQKPLVDRYDMTRPVTVAMHPHGRGFDLDTEPWPLALETDIASYNYRYMFFPNDGRRHPEMIFYQSEANASGMGPNFFEMDLDRVTGLAYWGMIDYLGESNGWPEKGWKHGAFDISLEPKPAAWFLRSYFIPDEPLVRIAVIGTGGSQQWNGIDVGTTEMAETWNLPAGATVDIYTYTNADEVELRVNGKTVGRKRNDTADPKSRNRIKWENVHYSPGKIEALAYNESSGTKPVTSHTIETTETAKKITATPDNNAWKADGNDLQHVRIAAVDSKGRQVRDAASNLHFSVEGPAEIAGVINGDIRSDELSTGDSRSLFNGTATVILRSTPASGKVKLTVTPDNRSLRPVTLQLETID